MTGREVAVKLDITAKTIHADRERVKARLELKNVTEWRRPTLQSYSSVRNPSSPVGKDGSASIQAINPAMAKMIASPRA